MPQDDRIRQRAYEIWEAEGRPTGREAAHWEKARQELSDGDREAESYADDAVVTREPSGTTTVAEHASGAVPTASPPPRDKVPQRENRRS